jgi:hypothetical protein
MNIPNLENEQFVDKDGHLTATQQNMLSTLVTQLQSNLQEGINVPMYSSDDIEKLDATKSTSKLIYDQTSHELKININGVFKTIQTA